MNFRGFFYRFHKYGQRATYVESWQFARKFASASKKAIEVGMKAMNTEVEETREMGRSFFRMLEHQLKLNEREEPPTKEEVKEAIEQLKDVGRFSFFATLVILPGGVVSLLGLELLARKFGMKEFTLIPSSFRKKKKKEDVRTNTN